VLKPAIAPGPRSLGPGCRIRQDQHLQAAPQLPEIPLAHAFELLGDMLRIHL